MNRRIFKKNVVSFCIIAADMNAAIRTILLRQPVFLRRSRHEQRRMLVKHLVKYYGRTSSQAYRALRNWRAIRVHFVPRDPARPIPLPPIEA